MPLAPPQLRAKKDQQADFLKKKLEMRRRAREKELVEGGMAPAEAARVSGAEAAVDEAVQLKALEQAFAVDLGAKQAALDDQMRGALGALKERHEGTLAALETGLAAQKEKKRKALEVRPLARLEMPPPPLYRLTSRHTNHVLLALSPAGAPLWPAWMRPRRPHPCTPTPPPGPLPL